MEVRIKGTAMLFCGIVRRKGLRASKSPAFAPQRSTRASRRPVRAATLVLAALLCGCGTTVARMYDGEARPIDEVARIEGSSSFQFVRSYRCHVLGIDGQSIDAGDVAEVLPGRHYVKVGASLSSMGQRRWTYIRKVDIVMIAEAGHSYVVYASFDFEFSDMGFGEEHSPPSIWIEDEETGDLVAGER